ncbi:hypothetical protein [Gordonia crocea]|uniref:Mce associated membrane protein n=1 Tax=Gordonia crocea TaxID=589162 RepID=A0A7I9UZ63_9ACTN|nr:hypothetical protein [Gordonia crocea]GED98243.1 hypothetical protein nbrc107697_22820 [Gordonia crocea]
MAKSAQPDDDRDDEVTESDDLSTVKRKARTEPPSLAKKSAPARDTSGDGDSGAGGPVSEDSDGGSDAEDSSGAVKAAARASDGGKTFSVTVNAASLRKAALALGAVVVVAALAFCGWQWHSANQKLRAFDEVKAAASRFIVTSIEYTSSDKVDQAKDAQGPLVTGKMRDELSQDRSEATKAMRSEGIKATAKVDSAAVESISGDEATTLMIVTATGTSNLSPTPQKRTVALRLHLRREDGKWLVSESKGVGDFSPTGVNPQPGTPGAPAPAPAPN